jgi:predicted aspartyl protease
MLRGWLREDLQAIVEVELGLSDGSWHAVPAVIDTSFNGQVCLSRGLIDEHDVLLTHQGSVDVELASGEVIEEDVFSGSVRFDGRELTADIIVGDAADSLIGTGLLTGKILLINFATGEVRVEDHVP